MALSNRTLEVAVKIDVKKIRQLAVAVTWFAGQLSAAAEQLSSALDEMTDE
jgi:hypothetical protein